MLTFQFGGFSPDLLKQNLKDSNTYNSISETISTLKLDEESNTGESSQKMANLFGPFIKKQFTPTYLQKKSESLIDDTYLWMQDKSKTPPVLSFSEIKTSIVSQNPQILTELKNLSKQLKEEQKNISTDDGEMDVETKKSMQELSKLDLDKFLDSDFSIPVGEKLEDVKKLYKVFKFALPIFIILEVIILGVILLLSSPLSSKVRWLGITFLITALFGIIPLITAFFLDKTSLSLLGADTSNPITKSFITLGDSFLKLYAAKYLSIQLVTTVGLFITGVALEITSKFINHSPTVLKTPKKPSR
jgi:hypothetical protein